MPLVLAWAMSIHKSQGQTIQYVKIDLRSVFEKGQSYVALSRAASLDGLQVLGFDPKKVRASRVCHLLLREADQLRASRSRHTRKSSSGARDWMLPLRISNDANCFSQPRTDLRAET